MRTLAAALLAAAALAAAGTAPLRAQAFEIVHAFSASYGEPQAPLIQGNDGRLYGTSKSGGFFGKGSVYALTTQPDGGYAFQELHAFSGPDGAEPIAPLVQASDGLFYGTTSKGGYVDGGTVFSMNAAGAVTKIHEFSNFDGLLPSGGLAQGSDGLLYGTTTDGGSGFGGVIFRIDASGAFAVLHEFAGYPTDGSAPLAGLIRASDGKLYGTASAGGVNNEGTIFRIDLAANYETVAAFDGSNGAYPQSALLRASNGYFYGVALYGGVFRVGYLGGLVAVPTPNVFGEMRAGLVQASDGMLYGSASQNFVSQAFRLEPDGSDVEIVADVPYFPLAALLELPDGRLAAPSTIGTIFSIDRFGSVVDLYQFLSEEGAGPWGALTQGSDGLLYGTTLGGGLSQVLGGWGTVFRISLDGTLQTIHSFDGTDGFGPMEKLLEASDGFFYGTTADPGSGAGGSAFRIDATSHFDFLHNFGYPEGSQPQGALAQGAGDRIFGVLEQGGDDFGGSIYEIDGSGTVTKRHGFAGTDGAGPNGLLSDSGAFYGVTRGGGANGLGTLFRFDPDDTVTTLWSFAGGTDGGPPSTGLIRATDGNLYGGQPSAIFRWTDPGPPTIVHALTPSEGTYPSALLEVGSGEFYGTAQGGGNPGGSAGTIFRMDSDGTVTVLHAFSGPDGITPYAAPILASDGDLYGTVPYGGPSNAGLVWRFRLSAPPSPTVISVVPDSGRAAGGTSIEVAGTGLQPLFEVTLGGVGASGVIDVDRTRARALSPVLTPGSLNDVTVTNPDNSTATLQNAFFADFVDVPSAHPFHDFIESIVRAGITAGCGGGNYCPDASVTRAQMAVFLLKAEHGAAYAPPACQGVFHDTPCPGPFTDWIEQLASEGITGGCGGGNYCPAAPVTRAQMAVFLLKTLLGSSYSPPPASGIFGDVPIGSFAADWIEDVYGRQITGGCSSLPLLYCPNNPNTRGQMAVFLDKTFLQP